MSVPRVAGQRVRQQTLRILRTKGICLALGMLPRQLMTCRTRSRNCHTPWHH
jgi:hypothetical protein